MFRTFPQTRYALCTVWPGSYFLFFFFLKQNCSQQAARIPPSVPPPQGTATWQQPVRCTRFSAGTRQREEGAEGKCAFSTAKSCFLSSSIH